MFILSWRLYYTTVWYPIIITDKYQIERVLQNFFKLYFYLFKKIECKKLLIWLPYRCSSIIIYWSM